MTDERERLEWLEAVAILWLGERYGETSADLGELRRQVRALLPARRREVAERVAERHADSTGYVQYTGRNADAVRAFCADGATINPDDTSAALWIVSDGRSERIRPGQWLARDEQNGRVYLSPPPMAYRTG